MNILFITSTFPRFKNDTQSPFVLEQAVAWKKAQPKDNVYVLAPHDAGAETNETIQGVSIRRFRYAYPAFFEKLVYPALLPNIRSNFLLIVLVPFFFIAQIGAILHMLSVKRIDVLYAHWFVPQGISACIAIAVYKMFHQPHIRFVLHNHSSDVALLRKIPVFGSVLVRTLVRCADVVFCVNTKLNYELKLLLSDTVTTSIHTMPMGVALNTVKEKKQIMYDFAFIGRFVRKKGLDFFLDALISLNKQGLFPRVAIAGGPPNPHYTRRIAQVRNAKYVGYIQTQEKGELLMSSRYVVLPSIVANGDYEGLPVVLLEGLSVGTGIIASKATNIELLPEWDDIKDSVYLLENPADIDEFATILRNCLKTQAFLRKQLTRYKWSNLIKEYILKIKKEKVPFKTV